MVFLSPQADSFFCKLKACTFAAHNKCRFSPYCRLERRAWCLGVLANVPRFRFLPVWPAEMWECTFGFLHCASYDAAAYEAFNLSACSSCIPRTFFNCNDFYHSKNNPRSRRNLSGRKFGTYVCMHGCRAPERGVDESQPSERPRT